MAVNKNRIAVLSTTIGDPLIVRSNPSATAVRNVVTEIERRYRAGESGGPSGIPSQKISAAHFYTNELDYLNGADAEEEIVISDLLNA